MGRSLILIVTILGIGLTLTACRPKNPVAGVWRSAAPASLLYEFRADGTIYLLADTGNHLVFHYQFPGEGTIRLFDGMGRMQVYSYQVTGNEMVFYNCCAPWVVEERFEREKFEEPQKQQ